MENILQQINALTEELQALQPIDPEFQRKLDKKFRLEFNYNSNHLEGNTLTYGETELLLIFDNTKGNHTMREYEEMQAHDVALRLVQEWAQDEERPLSEADICDLNKIILVRPYWKKARTLDGQQTRRQISVGKYKEYSNSVELPNGEIFEYAAPRDVPVLMRELIQWFRVECDKKEMHPVELAALLHYKFVLIHPFDDGNGRISRLLMNYVLLKFNYPPIIIKSSDKSNYLMALNRADVGELDFFVDYIAKQVVWSLGISIKAANGESIDEPDDLDKELELLRRGLASKNEAINKKAELSSLIETINDCLMPLFQFFEDKLMILNDFFIGFNRLIHFKMDGDIGIVDEFDSWYQFENNFSEVIAENILKEIEYKKEPPYLVYSYELEQLTKSENLPSFTLIIAIYFEEYFYSISIETSEKQTFKLRYGDILNQELMAKIVSPLIQHLISQIREDTN